MTSILDRQVQEVLKDIRARDYNIPGSQRTFLEVLTDPTARDLTKQDVVEAFLKAFPPKLQPPAETEAYATRPGEPEHEPLGAPTGGLKPGETISPATTQVGGGPASFFEQRISYDPLLEATQNATVEINLGSLVEGKMTPEGLFLAGPSRPGSPSIKFLLPRGMRPDEITQPVYDYMLKKAAKAFPKEYQAAKERDSAFKTFGVAAAREGILGLPALADLPLLAARGVDYYLSPTGTNTFGQDVTQDVRYLLGLPDARPRPSSIFMETYPRVGEALGLYTTEYPNALYKPNIIVRPDRELMPIHYASGKLLDEVLESMDMPGALTPDQSNEANRMAAFIGSVMGGSLTVSGAVRAGLKLAVKGMTLEDLQKAGALNRALYSLANSPGFTFAWGKSGRRFPIPGFVPFLLRDQGAALTSAGAMLITPDEAGPFGKIMAGLTAPFALSKAVGAVRKSMLGQSVSILGGFLEPFTPPGQWTLSSRYLASVPGIRGNEQLVRNLLEDQDNIPKRAGQDETVSTPAYFSTVSENLRQAEMDWNTLRQNGVSDGDAVAQLSQNPLYGRYFDEVSVFGEAAPTLAALEQARVATKLVSDNLYGAMSWLQTGSPIKNEVLRSTGERLRRAEETFKELSRNFEGDPADVQKYIQNTLKELEDLARDSMQTHAVDAALYIQLKKRLEEAIGPGGVMKSAADESRVAVEAIRNSLKEMRQIESAFWRNIGGDSIEISPENMALIGDKAAEIILNTPVAQRNQIPPTLYQLAGRNRLLSDEALESMARAAGASSETPASIRNARASLAGLREGREGKILPTVAEDALLAQQRKIVDESTATIDAAMARSPDWYASGRGHSKGSAAEAAETARNKALEKIEGVENKVSQRSLDFDNKIAMQEAKLKTLEDDLIPNRTVDDELIVAGPNGILDNVNTLDEVLAARGALIDAAAKAASRPGGANAARLANDAQKYIIDDWLQNPEIFGKAGTTAAYDAARKFSVWLNDLYTRSDSTLSKFLAQDVTRTAKNAPEEFLAQIIKENEVGQRTRPTGSLDALDAALVEAKAPFLVRGEDGMWVVDPDAGLTPGLENITWESIRTTGGEKLSANLVREELLNQLALISFDPKTGAFQPATVQKAVRSWDLVISKIESEFPNFRSELATLIDKGDELVIRSKSLERPTKAALDEALANKNLDNIGGALEAGWLTRRVKGDHSVAQIFLENDPNVVARELLANPSTFETDVAQTLRILDGDESGRATAGFKRALFDELTRKTLGSPEQVGRMAGEAVLDPSAINKILTDNETALRTVFSDFVGPPGSNMTTYDILKMFNDEISATMAERAGVAAGAVAAKIEPPIRGREMIRNLGRIVGVKLAGITGGPALVMAGTGGRLAQRFLDQGNMGAVFSLVADALVDPSKAKLMLVDSATLTKRGRLFFDRKLIEDVKPYLFYAGRPTEAVRVGVEEQREIDRIEREGGPTEIIFNPEKNVYERVSSRRRDAPSKTPLAPPRPISPASILSRAGLPFAHPLLPVQGRQPPPPVQGQPPPTGRASQKILTDLDQMGMPLFPQGFDKGGIVSIPRKPRQLVG
jgi:hypothetical protein